MIAQQYRDEMVRLVETVLDEIGPRESWGEAERRLGETLRRRWSELGLAVQEEPFRCHPRAFLGCVPITVGLDPGDRRRGSG
jgi:hypothetical protein